MLLRTILPEHHVSDESKDVVKLGIGMIATMAALVLGLLIASAKGSFDTASSGLRQAGSRIILLDRVMAHYGPETMKARDLLRRVIASSIARSWPEDKVELSLAKAGEGRVDIEAVQDQLRQLSPRNDAQRWLWSRALQISGDIAENRWLLIEQMGQSSIPMPFLVILVFWLTVIFATFGLFSPRNATVIVVLLVCALSAAGSLFLILELDNPYGGLIKVSSAPLRNALAHLGQVDPKPLP
ncbi:MAG: hypothetical protein NTW99_15590 [Chloroflexi bacterium]|nr:hypothetical protein [Deltaproteobacteria bacterium]MCX6039273.1 hypothetical protein [Chloroflexota bacterium]